MAIGKNGPRLKFRENGQRRGGVGLRLLHLAFGLFVIWLGPETRGKPLPE